MNKVKVQLQSKTAKLPTFAHFGDAACDLYADAPDEPIWIHPGSVQRVHCGIAIELPRGYAALVLPRSGLASAHMVTIQNSPGLIDSGYRGEIVALVRNEGREGYEVTHGQRIAQLLIVQLPQIMFEEVSDLSDSVRGQGGFGSSGR